MEIRRFITILEKYIHLLSEGDKVELMHTMALALEEDGEMNYIEIRAILKKHGCAMPKELMCKECVSDTDDTMLSCYWCGRYFHNGCKKHDNVYCSAQCKKIDVKIHSVASN